MTRPHVPLFGSAALLLALAAPVGAQVDAEVAIASAQSDTGEIAVVAGGGRWVAYNEADGTGVMLWDATTELASVVDAEGFNPAISDDGRWIAYSKFVGSQIDVFLWDRLAGSSERLSNSAALSMHASISDDGGVAVWRDGNGTLAVWRRATGTVETRPLNAGLPLVSGDGRFVVYADGAASAKRWELSSGTTVSVPFRFAAVSDDGNTIAYIVDDPGFTAGIGVGVHTVVGGGDAELTHARNGFGVGPSSLALSGDGSTLTFLTPEGLVESDTDGGYDTYRWLPETSDLEPLTSHRVLSLSDDGGLAVRWGAPEGTADYSYALLEFGTSSEPATTEVEVADLAAPQLSHQVTRLYRAFFLRSPDASGLEFWSERRAAGWSVARIADEFAASDEFVQRYGDLSDEAFVELVYQNVLDRGPDTTGYSFWVGQLGAGVTRGQMMVGFSESPENIAATDTTAASPGSAHQLWRLYSAYFGRQADQGGFDFWFERASNGSSIADISNAFAASDEFVATYGELTDAAFVELVYTNVLERSPDATGLAFWIAQLGAGLSRGSLMLEFSESPEYILKTDTLPA